jgi:hypothetical protein
MIEPRITVGRVRIRSKVGVLLVFDRVKFGDIGTDYLG